MCEIFNRKLSDDAIAFWMTELAPFYGQHLFEAMRLGMLEQWMPAVGWVIEKAERLERDDQRRLRLETAKREEAEYKAAIAKRDADWSALSQQERDRFNAQADEASADIRRRYPDGALPFWLTDERRGVSRFQPIKHREWDSDGYEWDPRTDDDLPF